MKMKFLMSLLALGFGLVAVTESYAQSAQPQAQWAAALVGGNKATRFSSVQWSSGQGMVADLSKLQACQGLTPDDATWTFTPAPQSSFTASNFNDMYLQDNRKFSFWMLYSSILWIVSTKNNPAPIPVGIFSSTKNQHQIEMEVYQGQLLVRCIA